MVRLIYVTCLTHSFVHTSLWNFLHKYKWNRNDIILHGTHEHLKASMNIEWELWTSHGTDKYAIVQMNTTPPPIAHMNTPCHTHGHPIESIQEVWKKWREVRVNFLVVLKTWPLLTLTDISTASKSFINCLPITAAQIKTLYCSSYRFNAYSILKWVDSACFFFVNCPVGQINIWSHWRWLNEKNNFLNNLMAWVFTSDKLFKVFWAGLIMHKYEHRVSICLRCESLLSHSYQGTVYVCLCQILKPFFSTPNVCSDVLLMLWYALKMTHN